MLFLLPIRTSIKPWRTPYMNYALIAINIIIYVLTSLLHKESDATAAASLQSQINDFMLTPLRPHLWQFISYAFLHGSIMHLAGNMFFLYLFGNNVNDRLGNLGYLCLYLAGAVFSGIGHTFMSATPVLGASGAIAAVTGAYLALFPHTLITVFYLLIYFIDTIEIPAIIFIGIKLIFWDNVVERSFANVAYDAHLSGYVFGILAMLVMQATGLIGSEEANLWAMIKQWNRRRIYRDTVSSGYDPFTGQQPAKKITVNEVKKPVFDERQLEQINQLRDEITKRISQRNLADAANAYISLIAIDEKQLPPKQYLLDVANQLASEGRHEESAKAYEKFLANYGNYEYIEQIELMLGIQYARYLNRREEAIKYLRSAVNRLTDPGQLKMCRDELAKLEI